jgi:hypothetical protein
VYIAGPMTGLPEFNYPAFRAAAAELRALGYDTEDPSDNEAKVKADPTWADYMRLGLTQMLTCEGIALLPGWESSRGASLEVHVARALGMEVADLGDWLAGDRSPARPPARVV